MSNRQYRAPVAAARAELKEKGSRFVAVVGPARDESEAQAALGVTLREPGR